MLGGISDLDVEMQIVFDLTDVVLVGDYAVELAFSFEDAVFVVFHGEIALAAIEFEIGVRIL